MKKLYPVAIRFILGGAVIVLIALLLCGFDLRQLNTRKPYSTGTLGITDDVRRVEIYDEDAVVMVEQGEMRGDVRLEVTCMENDEEDYMIIEEDGVLIVRYRDNRKNRWFNVDFGHARRTLTLTLPEESAHELAISVGSGDIYMQELELDGPLTLSVGSGDIFLGNVRVSGSVEADAGSGMIEFCDSQLNGGLHVSADSGHIYTYNMRVSDLAAEVASGYFRADNLRAKDVQISARSGSVWLLNARIDGDLQAKTASGSVCLERSAVAGKAEIDTSSGDVEFRQADFAALEISAMSGDVYGSLQENGAPYAFEVSAGSGDVHVPETDASGAEEVRPVTITTGSGDIYIEIEPTK